MNNWDKTRNQIDTLDNQIIKLILQRGKLAEKMGQLKKKEGKPIANKQRQQQIEDKYDDAILGGGKFAKLLIDYGTKLQKKIISNH